MDAFLIYFHYFSVCFGRVIQFSKIRSNMFLKISCTIALRNNCFKALPWRFNFTHIFIAELTIKSTSVKYLEKI